MFSYKTLKRYQPGSKFDNNIVNLIENYKNFHMILDSLLRFEHLKSLLSKISKTIDLRQNI